MLKRIISLSVLFIIIISLSSPALADYGETGPEKDTPSDYNAFGWDLGLGMSLGFFDKETGDYDVEESFMKALLSLRVGFNTAFRFNITGWLSTGVETGVMFMKMTVDSGSGKREYSFFDIPIRAIFRIGGGSTFLEPHAGYYIATGSYLGGGDLGVKLSLGGFFVEYGYIIGTEKYSRVALGWTFNNAVAF